MKEEAPLVNALKGALQAGGAICGIQCLLSMRLRAPNSLAISSAALIGIFLINL
jgi:formate dehydrogenase assembly factor FdhD